jgi:tetratricopeptide (TPR) repeat protein
MGRQDQNQPLAERLRILKKEERYAEAEEEIQRELKKDPDHPFFKASLADLYLRRGKLADGRILIDEILSQDPQNPQALSLLGDLFFKERSFRKALECYRQAFCRDPRDYVILRAARSLKEMKIFPEALQELEKVLVVKPKNLPFLKEKAIILNRMKKFDQALEVFERTKEISPDDPFVQKEIIRLRSLTKPDAQVVQELQTVMGMNSKKDDPQMHGLLAQKLQKAGLIKEAAAEYKTALTLDPGNLYFRKQEGFCHYRAKKYAEAIDCLKEAFEKDPADYYVRSTLEKSYEARGELAKFLELLERAVGQHPDQKALLGILRRVRRKLNPESPGERKH